MDKRTSKFRRLYFLFSFISFLLTFFPLIYYIITGYIESELTKEKVALTCMILCALVLVVINALLKYNIKSTIWLLILGIYVCVDNVLPLLLMIAIGTVTDEFIISPLKKSFKSKYTINKEIDKRI